VLIPAAMLGFDCAAATGGGGHRLWAGYAVLIAALTLLTAWSDAAGNGDVADLLFLSGGVVLIPARLDLDWPHKRVCART
jgi:hypothetical protein